MTRYYMTKSSLEAIARIKIRLVNNGRYLVFTNFIGRELILNRELLDNLSNEDILKEILQLEIITEDKLVKNIKIFKNESEVGQDD